jgi:hypothetical protein
MTPEQLLRLDKELAAVAPIDGVAVGVVGDRSTWRIDFQPQATDAEKAAAQAVLMAFDVSVVVYEISKLTVIDRLAAASKFDAALAALKTNDLLYEQWSAAQFIRSDNADARALFTAVGVDPDVILAPEV